MNTQIIISKINEVFFHLEVDSQIQCELYDYFKVKVPNCEFSPKFKLKMWDGTISFFNYQKNTIPIGLFDLFQKFCEEYNYSYKINFNPITFKDKLITNELLEIFYKEMFEGTTFWPRDYQNDLIREALINKRGLLLSSTGCHIKGSKILMFDGTFKNVEDVEIGDKLIGPDGMERNVLKLYKGIDDLYKIKPNKKANEFVVNKEHILHLQYISGDVKKPREKLNISVCDYINLNKHEKHLLKLVYNSQELNFTNNHINTTKLSAYFVGLYLGDGHTNQLAITTMDKEIEMSIYEQIEKYGFDKEKNIRVYNNGSKASTYFIKKNIFHYPQYHKHGNVSYNPITQDFKKLKIIIGNNHIKTRFQRTKCEDKFIPEVFKFGSIEDRYQILAGLIDTDGHLANNSYYEFCSKSEKLVDDVCFVARSLGFFVSKRIKYNKKYDKNYCCTIQGNIQKIPVKLPRKKNSEIFENKQKEHNIHGFKIEKIESGEYFGFELDSDHLYMMDNFLITHNSGKSILIYAIIRFILKQNKKIVLIVPNVSLVNQMYSDFSDYGWKDVEKNVTKLFTGQIPDFSKKVLITTFQSLVKKPSQFFEQYGAVLVDECHYQKANSLHSIGEKLINSEFRLGTTGTLDKKHKCDLYNIIGYLGPVLKEFKTKELTDLGFLTKVNIRNIIINHDLNLIKGKKDIDYVEEKKLIYSLPERNKILDLIFKHIPDDQNSLILVNEIEHLEQVKKYIENNDFKKWKLFIIHGKINSIERERIRKIIDVEKNIILLASFGTLSTGINIKSLSNIIFFSSCASEIRVLQSLGRGVRLFKDKLHVVIWDVVDSLRYVTKNGKLIKNYLFQHWEGKKDNFNPKKGRLDYYKEQQFEYKTLEKHINEL